MKSELSYGEEAQDVSQREKEPRRNDGVKVTDKINTLRLKRGEMKDQMIKKMQEKCNRQKGYRKNIEI